MANMTQRQCDRLPGPPAGKAQAIHAIPDTPGLLLVVGRRRRTFALQVDVAGRTRRKTLAATTLAAARLEAGALKPAMLNGTYQSPREVRLAAKAAAAGAPTLRLALAKYTEIQRMRGNRPGAGYLSRFLTDLLDVPLADITLPRLMAVHSAIAQGTHKALKRKAGQPCVNTANKVLKLTKSVWKQAHMHLEKCPPSPFDMREWRDLKVEEHPERPFMTREMFPVFWQETAAMSPLMRNLWRMFLLSGARRRTLCAALVEDYDRNARRLHFRKDKTGPYTIPLSDAMVAIIEEQIGFSTGSRYIFPRSRRRKVLGDRPVQEPKHRRMQKMGLTPHSMRRTFKNMCASCELSVAHEQTLMNHAYDEMSGVYRNREEIQRSPELAAAQQRVSAHALSLSNADLP